MVCKVEGCGMKHFAFGLCRKHHARFKRHGTTDSKYDKTGYAKLGGVLDEGQGRRGSLAVNIINDVKFKARQRGKEWAITHEQAFALITGTCVYCGHTPKWPEERVGIDRVYSDTGYVIENCVPCCFRCNSAKNDMGLDEFKEHIKKMYAFMFLK
jgi:hypothetical protein